MPISTLAELFAAGAQHTVEGFLERFPGNVVGAVDAMRRRFGPDLTLPNTELAVFAGRVEDAMSAARRLNLGETVLEAEIPSMPGATAGYTYTVITRVPKPTGPDEEPIVEDSAFTVTSPEPLRIEQIRARVDQMLEAWDPPRETSPGGPAADVIRRDVLIRSYVMDWGGSVSGLADTDVFAVYKR
jgi:hypothetical protein